MKANIAMGLAALLLLSCNETEINNGEIGTDEITVPFTVVYEKPMEEALTTRAFHPDFVIRNMVLLMFDEENRFMKRIDVPESAISGGTGSGGSARVTFTVRLKADTRRRTFHLVANGMTAESPYADRLNFSSLSPGTREEDALPALRTLPFPNQTRPPEPNQRPSDLEEHLTPMIMWSRVIMPNGVNVASTVSGVRLLRMGAFFQVKKATGATPENGLDNFTIKMIYAYNMNTEGYLIPVGGYSQDPITTPDTPRPIASVLGADNSHRTYSAYPDGQPRLFVYEQQANPSVPDNLNIIIRGAYDGQSGYYRIIPCDADGNPVHIVRNHRYTLTITEVNGPGKSSVDAAKNQAPSNILKAEVRDETGNYPLMIADSQHWIGVTNGVARVFDTTDYNPIRIALAETYSSQGGSFNVNGTLPAGLTLSGNAVSGGYGEIRAEIWPGVTTVPATTVKLTSSNFTLPFTFEFRRTIPAESADADSYVLRSSGLIGGTDRYWTVTVTDGDGMYLHPTKQDAADFDGTATTPPADPSFVRYLSSATHRQFNLHIAKGKSGTVHLTGAAADGTPYAIRLIIRQRR